VKRLRRVSITFVIVLVLFSSPVNADIWTESKVLTNSLYASFPVVAVNGSNIYVVWRGSSGDLYFKRSIDGGVTWETDSMLTKKNTGYNYLHGMAVNGPNIYVVWNDDIPGNEEIYFKRSADAGVSWTAEQRLSNNAGYSVNPAIAVNEANIYVVWTEGTPGNAAIFLSHSVDGGVRWKAAKRLTNTAGSSGSPAIAVSGANIYVIWRDSTLGNGEIYFKRSVDGGVRWTTTKRLTNDEGYSGMPAVAVGGSNIYLIWNQGVPGENSISFKRSVDGGVRWTATKRLSYNGRCLSILSIAADGADVCVAWCDYGLVNENTEIYFKRSADAGASWKAKQKLSNTVGSSVYPAVAVDRGNVYMVWEDFMAGNHELYFKKGVME
jgi:hypothetical protein